MLKSEGTFIQSIQNKSGSAAFRRSVFLIIVALQISLMFFWATQRSNYYIDEFFSFGSAHSYTFDKKDAKYINNSDDWVYEQWVDNNKLKDQLVITKETSLLSQPPLKATRMLLTRRNHQGILNILYSVFSPGKISMYPGIIFNLVIFFFTQILIYRIMEELTGSFPVSMLAVTMYGFSAMAIGIALYIRFYTLVIFLMLALIWLHQIMWRTEKLVKCEIITILCMVLIYFAMKDSELVFIIGGALIGCYALGLLIRKQFIKFLCYFLTIVPVSLFYALTKTNFIDIALHPEKYSEGSGAEAWMTQKLLTVNSDRLLALLGKYIRWFSDLLFGSWYIVCSFAVVIIILLELKALGRKPDRDPREDIDKRNDGDGNSNGFIWIIFGLNTIFLAFAFLTAFPATRYMSFFFPLVTILLWTLIGWLTKGKKCKGMVLAMCGLLTFTGIFITQVIHPENVDYVYAGDRPLIQAVQESGIEDAICIYSGEKHSNHAVYDCINIMPDTAKIYPMNSNKHQIDAESSPDRMLVWILNAREPIPYLADLMIGGYSLTKLGSTHTSDVYVIERR